SFWNVFTQSWTLTKHVLAVKRSMRQLRAIYRSHQCMRLARKNGAEPSRALSQPSKDWPTRSCRGKFLPKTHSTCKEAFFSQSHISSGRTFRSSARGEEQAV